MFQNYMRRLFWLILGVAVSSIGIAMMLQANVGLEPWSVLQQGMSLANRHDLRHSVRYRRRGSHPHGRALR